MESDNIILFIDEIHTIIGAGGAEGAIDAANIIKPSLSRGDLRVIGATTTGEYRKYIEKDSALERRFQPVLIDEPSESEAITILKGLRSKYEEHHGIKISDEAIESAVTLSSKYITDRYLPDKALDLIDEACSRARIAQIDSSEALLTLKKELEICKDKKEDATIYGDYEKACELRDIEAELLVKISKERERIKASEDDSTPTIFEKEIRDIVCLQTKIPINEIKGEEIDSLRELQKNLEGVIIGQSDAVESVSWAIKRGRLGIKDSSRPCASLFFLGPTGVGKTELAKQLAKFLFGSSDALVRFDMSEYSEKHSISKLIGAPAGYVGYEDEGRLSKAIRRSPYSVVLFDEIEKAHPDIYSLFLQILEEGEIKDSQGKKISFKSSIIIFTSNIGAWKASGVNIGFDMRDNGSYIKGEQMFS
jgi:ATP-dependent Clp protease ATP-binding subunit ClpC